VLLNAAATAFGFLQLRRLSDTLEWVVAPAIASGASDRARQGDPAPGTLEVEFFSDYACRFCRAVAPSLDTARAHFGSKVAWRYRFLPRSPREDPLGFRASLAGVCASRERDTWALYRAIAAEAEWSRDAFENALASLALNREGLENCMKSRTAKEILWADKYEAAALGIGETPTALVGTTRIVGVLPADSLIRVINAALAETHRP
jgi:protein-disulfide isomerase